MNIQIEPGHIVTHNSEQLGFIKEIHLGPGYGEKYVTIAAPEKEAGKYPKIKHTIKAFKVNKFEIRYDETVDGSQPICLKRKGAKKNIEKHLGG